MTKPTDNQLAAASKKARADFEAARDAAARLLAPPDPIDILAGVIADRGDVADERDELRAKCDAMTADLDEIHGMVGRPAVPVVEAVRRIRDELIRERDRFRSESKQATEEAERLRDRHRKLLDAFAGLQTALGSVANTLGLHEAAPTATILAAIASQRAALDRVAVAAGVDTDSTGAIVADLVVDAIRRLSSDRDQMRVAREDAAEDLERLNAILSTAEADAETQRTAADAAADLRAALDRVAMEAGVDTEGDGFDVADRVIAVLRAMQARQSSPTSRPAALPADLRTYLETRRDRLQGGHGLGLAAEIAALNRWLALPTAEVAP